MIRILGLIKSAILNVPLAFRLADRVATQAQIPRSAARCRALLALLRAVRELAKYPDVPLFALMVHACVKRELKRCVKGPRALVPAERGGCV